MLTWLFPRPENMRFELCDELRSHYRNQRIRDLPRSRHMRRDIGLDNGCGVDMPSLFRDI